MESIIFEHFHMMSESLSASGNTPKIPAESSLPDHLTLSAVCFP